MKKYQNTLIRQEIFYRVTQGLTEGKVIDQSIPERKILNSTSKAHKQSSKYLKYNQIQELQKGLK